MTDDTVISVENVSKAYRIWQNPAARLTSPVLSGIGRHLLGNTAPGRALQRRAAGSYRDFWALKDISFNVRRGEAIGIIGRNGSGKSTLLQIIAGTLQPTTGSVSVRGRVAALLELGSGFNPEFTGRENVYLNGAVVGLSRHEVEERFDSIAAFADIGEFIDHPVKTYSSGMLVRLAFSVATSVDADVLIVDEALSVGDVFFQQRCFKRIRRILDAGTTLFFVSHDLNAVSNLCDRGILLDEGSVSHMGPPEECESRYYAKFGGLRPMARLPEGTPPPTTVAGKARELLFRDDILGSCKSRHGGLTLEILAARISNSLGDNTRRAEMREHLRFEVLFRANDDVRQPACGLHFFDRMNNLVFAAGTPQLRVKLDPMPKGAELLVTFIVEMALQPGPYTFNIAVGEPDPTNANHATFHDVCEGLGPIDVSAPMETVWPFYGIARLPMKIEVTHG
jgi:lipopolysaccharide transport system ATP-binding protein